MKMENSWNLSKSLHNLNLEILSQKLYQSIAAKATSFEFSRQEIQSSTINTSEDKSRSIRLSTRCSSQMRSLHTPEMLRKVRFPNRSSKVDWFRVCNPQVRLVDHLRIDFILLLESAQFATRSLRANYFKKREKWVATEIAATPLNLSLKGRHRQASMEVDRRCHKRRIRCTRVIMQYLRHLPLLPPMLVSKSKSQTAPPPQIILRISNSHSNSKTHHSSRLKTRIKIQKSW